MNAKRILHGVYGGLAGGLVFGMMMAMMGMLPMIGKMIGQPIAAAGFLLHMFNSAIIGAGFAIVVSGIKAGAGSRGAALASGLTYGAAWWVLGPLTLMPLFMGMGLGVNWNLTAAAAMLPSLMGHMIYGAVLGLTYVTLQNRASVARMDASLEVSPVGID